MISRCTVCGEQADLVTSDQVYCGVCRDQFTLQAEFELLFLELVNQCFDESCLGRVDEFWRNRCHRDRYGYLSSVVTTTRAHIFSRTGRHAEAYAELARLEVRAKDHQFGRITNLVFMLDTARNIGSGRDSELLSSFIQSFRQWLIALVDSTTEMSNSTIFSVPLRSKLDSITKLIDSMSQCLAKDVEGGDSS